MGRFIVWRSFFLAVGIMLLIVGIECLIIDSATLYSSPEYPSDYLDPAAATGTTTRVVSPSEWMPWSLLSAGGIVVLYAVTLPKRWNHA